MIKSLKFILIGLVVCNAAFAQRFTETQQIDLPDTVSVKQVEWVDMDNDGLLDILVIAENLKGQYFYTYKNNTISGFSFVKAQATGFSEGVYVLHDYDGDNKIDVAVSGKKSSLPTTSILANLGGFEFQEEPLGLEVQGTNICFADFNNDGKKELVLSGKDTQGPFLTIYRNVNNSWEIVNDSVKVMASTIRVFDFNADLFNDIMISGVDENGAPYLSVQYSDGHFKFKSSFDFPTPIDGSIDIGDITNDGLFDAVIAGKNNAGVYKTYRAINQKNSFVMTETNYQLEKPDLFIADIDIDGVIDFNFLGLDGIDTVNVIEQSASVVDVLPHKKLGIQRFGDYDHDGDLDLLQVNETAVTIFKNSTPTENDAPKKPPFTFSSDVFNRTFFYWDKSIDDHTDSPSLTYDFSLNDISKNLVTSEFDLKVLKRLTVSHGNSGTNNFYLFGNVLAEYNYKVQAIDNSFHAGAVCEGGSKIGLCHNSTVYEDQSFCKSEHVSLDAGGKDVLWFSFAEGFLGLQSSMSFTAEKSDTLFYYDRSGACGSIKAFALSVADKLVRESFKTKYVCMNDNIPFAIDGEWDSIAWSSSKLGFLSKASSIKFKVSQHDTVQVYLLSKPGCIDIRKTELIISTPEATVNGEVFQIVKGSTVQIEAAGGETYNWSPPTGLSDPHISNPVVSPVSTIEYQVIVSDSIGCTASKKVLVKVEQTAFIPSLFTPNKDGNNDYLKVYGLASAMGFKLKIYNREGNAVFETADPSTAGWDGTRSGVEQPSGVYYWKVEGNYNTGEKLLLNGKSSGSVVLMR